MNPRDCFCKSCHINFKLSVLCKEIIEAEGMDFIGRFFLLHFFFTILSVLFIMLVLLIYSTKRLTLSDEVTGNQHVSIIIFFICPVVYSITK